MQERFNSQLSAVSYEQSAKTTATAKAAGERESAPNHRPIRRAQDGAPGGLGGLRRRLREFKGNGRRLDGLRLLIGNGR
jgi:hypothetical protein